MASLPIVAYPDEILKSVPDRMAALGLDVIPVVARADARHLEGIMTQFDILNARQKPLEEERRAERVLTLRRVNADTRNREGVTAPAGSENAGAG